MAPRSAGVLARFEVTWTAGNQLEQLNINLYNNNNNNSNKMRTLLDFCVLASIYLENPQPLPCLGMAHVFTFLGYLDRYSSSCFCFVLPLFPSAIGDHLAGLEQLVN